MASKGAATFEELPEVVINRFKELGPLGILRENSEAATIFLIFMASVYLLLSIYANIGVSIAAVVGLKEVYLEYPIVSLAIFILINLMVLSFWRKKKLLKFLRIN